VHRIGRTARAGADGVAISFCDGEERAFLRDIEKLIRMTIPAMDRRTAPQRQSAAVDESWKPQPQPAAGKHPRHSKGRPAQRDRRNRARTDGPEYAIADVAFMRRGNEQRRDGRR